MKKSKVIFLALLACAFGASARTTSPDEARYVALGWNRLNASAFGALGSVRSVAAETNALGAVQWYVVRMEKGAAIVAPNDEIEPVVAVLPGSDGYIPAGHPLRAMLERDMANRLALLGASASGGGGLPRMTTAASSATANSPVAGSTISDKAAKWDKLKSYGRRRGFTTAGLDPDGNPATIVRWLDGWNSPDTEDGVQTLRFWNQKGSGQYFTNAQIFNLYTPTNAPCGCVATAGSSVLHYFRVPSGNVVTNKCEYQNKPITLASMGGDYDWSLIDDIELKYNNPFELQGSVLDLLGRVAYDCGVGCGMSYDRRNSRGKSEGSGSSTCALMQSFRNVFNVKNVQLVTKYGGDFGPNTESGDIGSDNYANLIYNQIRGGAPVVMGILGHEVVACGYGYDADKTDYTYVFLGWGGIDDAWYALPTIETKATSEGDKYTSTFVDEILTEISPFDDKYVAVVGRLVDSDGNPIAGGTITLGAGPDTLTTDERGYWGTRVSPTNEACYVTDVLGEKYEYEIGNAARETTSGGRASDRLAAALPNAIEVRYTPSVRINGHIYGSLSTALANVQEGDVVEILQPTELKNSVVVSNDCTILATNVSAAASAITCRNGAQITVAAGATVTMTNVVFNVAEKTKTVVVEDSGALKIGGVCGLEFVETQDADNLVVVAPLSELPVYVDCANAVEEGDTFASGEGLPYEMATNCANLFLNYGHSRLGGSAYTNESGEVFFKWLRDAPVPRRAAAGRLNGTNYRSLDDILEDYDSNTASEIVIFRDAAFADYLEPATNLVLRGEGGARPVLTASGDSGFLIEKGGSLVISNLVFTGYVDDDTSDDYGFIGVDGGELTLDDGAVLESMTGHADFGSGIIDLQAGTATMRAGASIVNCRAEGGARGTGLGGAIYVLGEGCDLNLEGGVISNCYAATYGGGVYAFGKGGDAGISVSDCMKIRGNRSGNFAVDNLYMFTAEACGGLKLVAASTDAEDRSIGIRYCNGRNAEGAAFMTNAVGAVGNATLYAFFNDTDDTLTAATNASGMLVWAKDTRDPRQCDEASAEAKLIAGDSVTYWKSVSSALNEATNNCVVEVLVDADLVEDVAIAGTNVTLRSAAGNPYGLALYRAQDVQFAIAAGSGLVVTNVDFYGRMANFNDSEIDAVALFDVDGGKLSMLDADIFDILGYWGRNANAITVYNGGTLVMDGGSQIDSCYNLSLDPSGVKETEAGAGGAILVDNATAVLRNTYISNCRATKGGGVFACNGATIRMSGLTRILYNTLPGGSPNNLEMSDSSKLILDGPLTGIVYDTPGYLADTNLIATVGYDWTGSVVSLANSAAQFRSDSDVHDVGVAVTNGAAAKIVWSTALENGIYTCVEGGKTVRYALAGVMPDIRQCLDTDDQQLALAKITDARGDETYWWHVDDALGEATDNCTVDVRGDDILRRSITVRGTNVTLRAACDVLGGYALYRATDASIAILSGCGLSITNMNFSGGQDKVGSTNSFFDVRGGLLKIDNVGVYKMTGLGESNAAAIAVTDGGRFEMYNSEISSCSNRSEVVSGVGAGGGLFVDGATAYLLDGFVTECSAAKGGGVFACNGAKVYVADHMCVCDNQNLDKEDSNLELSDSAELIVTGELTGLIGMTPKSLPLEHPCDTNLVATVSTNWLWSVEALTNSAAAFENDLNGDVGAAVTNGTKALIVWCGALKDGLYEHSDGKVYALVTGEPGEEPSEEPVEGPLPELAANASEDDVNAALLELDDSAPAEKITTIEEYNDFRDWAQEVGVDDVATSPYAYLSYEFGTEALLENEPTVEITEVANDANGLTVSIVVKDGEDPVKVAGEKVAEMFEATSDVGDWTKTVGLTVGNATPNADKSISFTVVPAGNPPTTFIRLKY